MSTFFLLAAILLLVVGITSPKLVRMSRKKTLLFSFALLICMFIFSPSAEERAKAKATREQAQYEEMVSKRKPLPTDITDPFLKPGSKLYNLFGKERSKSIESDRIAFAQTLIDEKKCKTLEYVAISEKSTKSQAKFFADCAEPKQRFFKDEGRSGIYTAEDTAVSTSSSKTDALAQCRSMISEQATFKSKVDFSLLNTAVDTLPNGTTRAVIGFEAMNGLGNMLPYTASCEFTKDGKTSISIQTN
jgi:hypothetical protein